VPGQALAQEVACYLGLDLSSIKIKRFADGEIYVQVQVRTPCRPPPAALHV
jgi:phosphoribosylpyrophosphate synthetase